jgi:hypothetical protein
VALVAAPLPERQLRGLGEGGYAPKEGRRRLPAAVNVVSRLLITGKLSERPQQPAAPRRGCPPQKGPLLGSPKRLAHKRRGWQPHPREAQATGHAWEGLGQAVLPGRLLRVVVVRRPVTPGVRKPGQRKPPPPVEAFFTPDLTLSVTAILAQYRDRWAVDITIRESNACAGLGQAQCRKVERVVGANTVRLVRAAARTLGFLKHPCRAGAIDLGRYRPWYRQKCAPSHLDIVWACREALHVAGVFPIPRFAPDLAANHEEPEIALPLAA